MLGRCRAFFENRNFGFLESSSNGEVFDQSIFFSGDTSSARPGDFVEFQIDQDWEGRLKAFNIQSVSRDLAPRVARIWQGTVSVVRARSARIDYIDDDRKRRNIWCSLDQLEPADDGLFYVPTPGCRVNFQISRRQGRNFAAVGVRIIDWPEQSIEDYFVSAEELALDVPEPIAVSAICESVLAPANRNIPMIELIRDKRKGKSK